jgi:hypothetical protein
MQRIKNVTALRQSLATGQREFRLLLGDGYIYSRKTVTPCSDGRFKIVNHIDDSVQRLTGRQLYTRSNIGKAMRLGSFLAVPPENY